MIAINTVQLRTRLSRLGHIGFACAFAVSFGAAVAQPAALTPSQANALSDPTKRVDVVLTQMKVVQVNGAEQLKEAPTVQPGDVIEYRATYTNNTGKPVTGLQADLPIPEGLEYMPRSAKPAGTLVKAAVAGGDFAAEPLTRKLPNGKTEPVAYNDYRALRWTLGQLPANGVTAVSARAKVEVVVPKAPVSVSSAAAQAPPATAAIKQ